MVVTIFNNCIYPGERTIYDITSFTISLKGIVFILRILLRKNKPLLPILKNLFTVKNSQCI